MFIKSLGMALAGLALVAAPVAASAVAANSASSLSLSAPLRAGTAVKGESKLAEGASVVPFMIGAGIIAGVASLVIDHEDKDDDSDSN